MCTFILSSGDDYQKTTTSATVGSSYTFSNSSITCLNLKKKYINSKKDLYIRITNIIQKLRTNFLLKFNICHEKTLFLRH